MTLSAGGDDGRAVVVPVQSVAKDISILFDEAEALWAAEQPSAKAGTISANWGCVGVCFRDIPQSADWAAGWVQWFREKKVNRVDPVNDEGLLGIPWPTVVADGMLETIDVLIATATMAEKEAPSPEEIADAWVDQSAGHESYFFQNVKNGIRTSDDVRIWHRISQRQPDWLSGDRYADAIAILESG